MKKLTSIISVLLILLSSCKKDKIELLKHPEIKDWVKPDRIKN